jgi:hypothetical protein
MLLESGSVVTEKGLVVHVHSLVTQKDLAFAGEVIKDHLVYHCRKSTSNILPSCGQARSRMILFSLQSMLQ